MRAMVAGLIAGTVGIIVAVLTVAAAMWAVVGMDSCDRSKHICDVAPMAGFGLGILLAPITGIVAVVIVAGRLSGRPGNRRAAETADTR